MHYFIRVQKGTEVIGATLVISGYLNDYYIIR